MDDTRPQNGSSTKPAHKSSIRSFFTAEVSDHWTDLPLLASCFITGLLDSAVFNVWSCFVGMQTGNTIYTGLGVSAQPASQPFRWVKSGTSILSFLAASFIFGRVARALGETKRGTLIYLFLTQAILCFVPAAIVQTGFVPADAGDRLPGDYIVLLPLSMLAMQSGIQMVTSRLLGHNGLPSVVLTSSYCDLVLDPMFFAGLTQNVKRNQRAMSAVLMFSGAVWGGFLTRGGHIALALWITGALKLALAVAWCFWSSKGSIRLP